MIVQIRSLINVGQKISQFRFILKIVLFSVWVPISEEKKSNPRKPYLGVLVRIAESLYSGGSTSPYFFVPPYYHLSYYSLVLYFQ
jgi:hypothetical protein